MDLSSLRLAATYSIVARDPATGELGVAVQSNYFSVGTEVSWAEPGVGAIATQAIIEVSYGPKGLELLAQGVSPEQALEQLVTQDPGAPLRQVGVVDAQGRVAAHTGAACIPACSHALGESYSIQGNMLDSDEVLRAMGPAFEKAEGDLAERLMVALEAAERAGGDVRGRQSAALLVVSGERPENSWEGRLFDLHVEDDPHPLAELRRLLRVRRAFTLFEQARVNIGLGDLDTALEQIHRARELKPDDSQFAFWIGMALANVGRNEEAKRWLAEAFESTEAWREMAYRLRDMGVYSGDLDLLEP
jgi:uncharacterized Ntn-hydrolase superfamily protein